MKSSNKVINSKFMRDTYHLIAYTNKVIIIYKDYEITNRNISDFS